MEEIQIKISKIMKEQFNINIINNENIPLVELGIDSLKYINILVELENEFSIEFPDSILYKNRLKSISDITNLISKIYNNIIT